MNQRSTGIHVRLSSIALVLLWACAVTPPEIGRLHAARTEASEPVWRAYVRDFPGTPGAEEGRAFLDTRERERRWGTAINLDTVAAYEEFHATYPESPEAVLAMKRISTLLDLAASDRKEMPHPQAPDASTALEIVIPATGESPASAPGEGDFDYDWGERDPETEARVREGLREIDRRYAGRIEAADRRIDDKRNYIAELKERVATARAERDSFLREAEDLELEARTQNLIFGASPANPTRAMLEQARALREAARQRAELAAELSERVGDESRSLRDLQGELSELIGRRDAEKRELRRAARDTPNFANPMTPEPESDGNQETFSIESSE